MAGRQTMPETDDSGASSSADSLSWLKGHGSPIIVKKKYINKIGGNAHCAIGDNARIQFPDYENCNNLKHHESPQDLKDGTNSGQGSDSSFQKQTAHDVLNNFGEFLSKLSEFRGRGKDHLGQFIITDLLPVISKQYRSGGSGTDALEVLSRLSCTSLGSPNVVKHSLSMLQECVRAEFSKECANAHVKKTEEVLRAPFANGSFKSERMHEQRLRMGVYSDFLIMLLLCQSQGHFTRPYNKDERRDILQVMQAIEKRLNHEGYRRKNRLRYAMEMIILTANRLFTKKPMATQLHKYLEQVMSLLNNGFNEEEVEELVSKLREAEQGYFDLHVILKVLNCKVASNSKAFPLLLSIIKKQKQTNTRFWKHTKEDWQFVLLACEILHDILMKNKNIGKRREAAECLVEFHGTPDFLKSHVLRAIIEKYLLKSLFCPDIQNRSLIIQARFNTAIQTPLPVNTLKTHVCKLHRTADLEISNAVFEDEDQVVFRGLFGCEPVCVKVLTINDVSQLYNGHTQERSHPAEALQNEIVILKKLKSKDTKEHVIKLLAADITNLPYHMITEFMSCGNLLDYLRECRDINKFLHHHQLLTMAIDISKGMKFIGEKGVVHCQLRAENVLVAEDLTCKVSGFHRSRAVRGSSQGFSGRPMGLDDPSNRWAAPECRTHQAWFSIQSDVWSFGILLYELFTYGCVPYYDKGIDEIFRHVISGQHLPKEECIGDGVYAVMQKCWTLDKDDRIPFKQILRDLQRLLAEAPEEDTVPPNLPPLKQAVEQDEYKGGNGPFEETENASYCALDISKISKGKQVYNSETVLSKLRTPFLVDTNPQHLKNLRSLCHRHVVAVLDIKRKKSNVNIRCEEFSSTLHCYILEGRCDVDDLTRFSAQIASGLNYLHTRNIVHGNLRASNIMVVHPHHVKISGLARCKMLNVSPDEENSSLCVEPAKMSPDALRWSAPEVILDGYYSHSSDVWSLAVLLWECFTCLGRNKQLAIPYPLLKPQQVLDRLKKGERLYQPENCPDWIYVLMTQCWPISPIERASSLAVLECLSSKCPWESYILQLWLRKHEVLENWPNLSVTVMGADEFVLRAEVERSATAEFLGDHNYEYESNWSLRRVRQMVGGIVRKIQTRFNPIQTQKSSWYSPPSTEENSDENKSENEDDTEGDTREQKELPLPIPPIYMNTPPQRPAKPISRSESNVSGETLYPESIISRDDDSATIISSDLNGDTNDDDDDVYGEPEEYGEMSGDLDTDEEPYVTAEDELLELHRKGRTPQRRQQQGRHYKYLPKPGRTPPRPKQRSEPNVAGKEIYDDIALCGKPYVSPLRRQQQVNPRRPPKPRSESQLNVSGEEKSGGIDFGEDLYENQPPRRQQQEELLYDLPVNVPPRSPKTRYRPKANVSGIEIYGDMDSVEDPYDDIEEGRRQQQDNLPHPEGTPRRPPKPRSRSQLNVSGEEKSGDIDFEEDPYEIVHDIYENHPPRRQQQENLYDLPENVPPRPPKTGCRPEPNVSGEEIYGDMDSVEDPYDDPRQQQDNLPHPEGTPRRPLKPRSRSQLNVSGEEIYGDMDSDENRYDDVYPPRRQEQEESLDSVSVLEEAMHIHTRSPQVLVPGKKESNLRYKSNNNTALNTVELSKDNNTDADNTAYACFYDTPRNVGQTMQIPSDAENNASGVNQNPHNPHTQQAESNDDNHGYVNIQDCLTD